MKNKEVYDLRKLVRNRRRVYQPKAYLMAYTTIVTYEGKFVAQLRGGSIDDLMAWLEEEYETSTN